MLKLLKRATLIIVVFLTIFVIWEQDKYENNEILDLDYSQTINISNLPDNIIKTLNILEDRAVDLKINYEKNVFQLDNINLSREKYITANTPLILQRYFEKSDTMDQNIVKMPDSFVGLSINELKKILDEWNIKSYKANSALTLYRSLNKFSSEELNYMHLGIKDGKIAIFYGKEGSHLKSITEISIDSLSEVEINMLKKGIVINNDEELLAVLDGLISSINND
ncbi:MAG: BofC C-terminal domain-containing protein [Halanaerobiaceae bacterium]